MIPDARVIVGVWLLAPVWLILWSADWGFRSQWIRLFTVIGLWALLAFAFLAIPRRLRALPCAPRDTPEVRKWTRVLKVSTALFVVAIAALHVFTRLMLLQLDRLAAGATHASLRSAGDAMDRWFFWFGLASGIYIGVAPILIAIMIWASIKRNRARFPKESTDRP